MIKKKITHLVWNGLEQIREEHSLVKYRGKVGSRQGTARTEQAQNKARTRNPPLSSGCLRQLEAHSEALLGIMCS